MWSLRRWWWWWLPLQPKLTNSDLRGGRREREGVPASRPNASRRKERNSSPPLSRNQDSFLSLGASLLLLSWCPRPPLPCPSPVTSSPSSIHATSPTSLLLQSRNKRRRRRKKSGSFSLSLSACEEDYTTTTGRRRQS